MILISGGHYPGKVGASYDGFNEFPTTMVWAHDTMVLLERMGLPASLVPSGTLTKKVQFINDFDARGQAVWCAIEIHFNAGGGQGTETLYYPGSVLGEKYAQAVQDQLWPVFGKDRGVKEGWYQQDKSKGTLHFLKATHCPSIIVKPESIEHHKDIIQKRKEGCAAIAEALYAVAHGNI